MVPLAGSPTHQPRARANAVRLSFVLAWLLLLPPDLWSQERTSPATVVTASKLEEARRESPVPITVITDTMIADIGALSLKDVLLTYVPGVTFSQDHNDVNVAMRGVYASSQQKILMLIDGHVVNSRVIASADPDFGIGIDRIKRIEVLRGPASALYGNGALTAVVHIFTKTADDVPGTLITAGAGNWGQVKFSGLSGGKTDNGSNWLAWGTIYRSDGQTVEIPAAGDYSRNPGNAQAILNGFSGPASHDTGLSLETSAFNLRVAHRLGKYIEPFSAGGSTGESYNYADYQQDNGIGPGQAIRSLNVDLSHERAAPANGTLVVRGYFDRQDLMMHLVTDPSVKAHSSVRSSEWDAGVAAEVHGSYASKGKQGQWVAGAQADVARAFDSVDMSGTGGGWTTVGPSGGLLEVGGEQIYSGYVEVKQPLGDKLIANAGIRYDGKVRHEGAIINRASPRAALVFLPGKRTTVAVSYADAFVDAPYFYRYNSLPSYRGSRTLQPEHLQSIQITPSTTLPGGITLTSNMFFNKADNLIWRNKHAGPSDPIYQNAGFLRNWGIEPEMGYVAASFNVSGNFTYQRASGFRQYDVTGGSVHNVPNWTGNTILNVRAPSMAGKDVWVNVTARYIGPQVSPINITIGASTWNQPDRTVDGVFLANAGVRVGGTAVTRWFLDARIYNLFDADYEQGGSVSHPYPQPGRSGMLTIGFRL